MLSVHLRQDRVAAARAAAKAAVPVVKAKELSARRFFSEEVLYENKMVWARMFSHHHG